LDYFFTTPAADDQDDDDDDDDDAIIALPDLFDDNSVVESGVTSGADPTSWDPIDIDRKP
jgi:hypothetical protein